MHATTVIGSGVSGLTCALVLLDRGHRVRVLAREFAWRTTSAVAAAIWFPYEARPAMRVHAWARTSFAAFERLAPKPETGVVMTPGVIYARARAPQTWWREVVPAWQPLASAELPQGVVAGDRLCVPVAEMPLYLQFLVGEIQRRGGRIEQGEVHDLQAVDADTIVNCTGLGAAALADDPGVYPIRGQVVCTERLVHEFVVDDDNPDGLTYIIPRSRDCVLGGSADPGVDDLTPRAAETAAVLARCADLRPALRAATVREARVGLRPGRATVRLDLEQIAGGRRVVHNYGHGGSGMTLSWGCAEEVARLVEEGADGR